MASLIALAFILVRQRSEIARLKVANTALRQVSNDRALRLVDPAILAREQSQVDTPVPAHFMTLEDAEPVEEAALLKTPSERKGVSDILKAKSSRARIAELAQAVRSLIEGSSYLSPKERTALLKNLEQINSQKGIERNGRSREAEIARIVAKLPNNSVFLDEWRSAYVDDPARLPVFLELAVRDPLKELEVWDERTAGWTDWESRRYRDGLLGKLAGREPGQAVALVINNSDLFTETAIEEAFSALYRSRSNQERGGAFDLNALGDSRLRAASIRAKAKSFAVSDTRAALAWADSLTSPDEQDLAHTTIYDITPRGVGVSIYQENGFPTVGKVIATGPSAGKLQAGDRVVQLTESDGSQRDLDGYELGDVVRHVRGEPGSTVVLKILRKDPASGQYKEVDVELSREQLAFGD